MVAPYMHVSYGNYVSGSSTGEGGHNLCGYGYQECGTVDHPVSRQQSHITAISKSISLAFMDQ